jgi:hypothetical protein
MGDIASLSNPKADDTRWTTGCVRPETGLDVAEKTEISDSARNRTPMLYHLAGSRVTILTELPRIIQIIAMFNYIKHHSIQTQS